LAVKNIIIILYIC